ncbi:YhdH/YhfP family quinone oxidoreductase [Fusibacter paucivorans]|uniref:YhdH/YhfP family quinone oxidoreductase n=1 Tax=Fusibacter paucivorans TaxID=76009 RepID=A0ABS5PRW7_9FIRM|nr:YhdH/YhfP family quinone oxidoreductase [Fusibacter paucivorans]MBS7527816.1 YhdH/YhfP family quinone oxidoreductase [Fusibacter paucivorans]
MNTFRALEAYENTNGQFEQRIIQRAIEDLPDGELLIKVAYSSLNYKDALSASGNRGVTKKFPHTPGIDAAGTIVVSRVGRFKVGDPVIITGYDLGMNTFGGFSNYIRVPANWAVALPDGLTLKESMIYGTAGFTAALSIDKLLRGGVQPEDGDILVTGATGGVGSMAVSILAKLGYRVIGATGKSEAREMLMSLGAADIINRREMDDDSGRAMLRSRWAGVIDTVGGNTLATALKTTQYGGCVTCCGNVAAADFTTTVYPFILNGITLFGIDSVNCPMAHRLAIWARLADAWKPDTLQHQYQTITLVALPNAISLMLSGQHKGRTIIKLDD